MPTNFAIVAGWQVRENVFYAHEILLTSPQSIIKAIFPTSIDGDLLQLLHLLNSFKVLEGQKPLTVGDRCRAEAHITAVINNNGGKVVKVKGLVVRDGKPVLEVALLLLYCGKYFDYENTFELIDEPNYLVEIQNDTAVVILQSK